MKELKLILIALVLVSFNGCFFFSSTPKAKVVKPVYEMEYCSFPEDFVNRTNKISQALKKSKSDYPKYEALLDPKTILNSYNAIRFTNCNERLEIYNAALKEVETKNLKENNIKKAIDDEINLWIVVKENIQKKAKENAKNGIRYETPEELKNNDIRKKKLSRY